MLSVNVLPASCVVLYTSAVHHQSHYLHHYFVILALQHELVPFFFVTVVYQMVCRLFAFFCALSALFLLFARCSLCVSVCRCARVATRIILKWTVSEMAFARKTKHNWNLGVVDVHGNGGVFNIRSNTLWCACVWRMQSRNVSSSTINGIFVSTIFSAIEFRSTIRIRNGKSQSAKKELPLSLLLGAGNR